VLIRLGFYPAHLYAVTINERLGAPDCLRKKETNLNTGIHLVRFEYQHSSDEQQVDPEELSGVTYVGNSRVVTDLVLVNGRYMAIEHLDDGEGPLPLDD
jgi:hypothetical protein